MPDLMNAAAEQRLDRGRRRDEKVSAKQLALRIEARGGFRRTTWRQGTKQPLTARFALRRVVWAGKAGRNQRAIDQREAVWLLVEWRDGESEPANYFFCSIAARMTSKRLVRLVMQRWRTERAYEDLKGELGLDHDEGRRFPGWHHHVSVVLRCDAFVVAERARRPPPLGPRGAGRRRAAARGPSGITPTASSPCGSRSPARSPAGCRVARPATRGAAIATARPVSGIRPEPPGRPRAPAPGRWGARRLGADPTVRGPDKEST